MSEQEQILPDQEMISLPVESAVVGQVSKVDLYINIGNEKYIKIVRSGQKFDLERIRNYQAHKVEFLYVTQDQYLDYLQNALELTNTVSQSKEFSTSQKLTLLLKSSNSVFHELTELGVDRASVLHAGSLVNSLVKIVDENAGLNGLLAGLMKLPEDFMRHSMAVSSIAVILANCLGWRNERVLFYIGLGGLLHDVGMKELNPILLEKKRVDFTKEEVEEYETHPLRSRDILMSVGDIPSEVVSIVYEHHEQPGGRGFPQGLGRDKIYPLARLVALSDIIVHQIIQSKANPQPKSLTEALKYISPIYRNDFDSQIWAAISKWK